MRPILQASESFIRELERELSLLVIFAHSYLWSDNILTANNFFQLIVVTASAREVYFALKMFSPSHSKLQIFYSCNLQQ